LKSASLLHAYHAACDLLGVEVSRCEIQIKLYDNSQSATFGACIYSSSWFGAMLDPLSALSVAGTIVQFVNFSSELLSQGRELYKMNKGQLMIDTELELVINDLCAVIKKFRGPLTSGASNATEPDDPRAEFDKICDTAASIAEELLGKLENMKVDRPKDGKWKTLCQIVKIVWSRDEIEGFVKRLNTLREAINTRITSVFLYVLQW